MHQKYVQHWQIKYTCNSNKEHMFKNKKKKPYCDAKLFIGKIKGAYMVN